MNAAIDVWFDFASNYSYLSVMRIEALAQRAGATIRWQPFLLGPIFASFGWAQTEKARALGIFGAPAFFVGNEMYWGNDRLDDVFDSLRERGIGASRNGDGAL